MKSIVVFNNKGGVGKTTLLCNLASFLAIKKKKKVLIVDSDPQCNATAYMFSYPELDTIYGKKGDTIYDILKPLQRGKGYIESNIPIIRSKRFGLDVIVGDPQLSLVEDFLSKDWLDGKSGDYRGLQTTLVFGDLLLKLSKKYDYIFFDVGPSLGALNRSVLAASDFFIVPMSSDIFSLQAIENISISLKEWKNQLTRGLDDFEHSSGEPFTIGNKPVEWKLQFAGYITQQYTARAVQGKKQPVAAYEKIIKKIAPNIKKHLSPLNKNPPPHLLLGEIPSLHSLVPMSQSNAAPIFELVASDGVVGAHFNKVKDFEKILKTIATNFATNLDSLL